MKAATITIPDDLDAKLDEVARERNVTQTEVIQMALRRYLAEFPDTPTGTDDEGYRPLRVSVIPENDDHGEPDVSINHDHYLAEDLLRRKLGRT